MKDLQLALDQLSAEVKAYRGCDLQNGNALNHHLQQITGIMFYLSTAQGEFKDSWDSEVQQGILSGLSVARAEHEADIKFPQLYKLRKIYHSADLCASAIRTHISYLKSERNL